ncbi:sigma-70 family RNA polymerase sigma factor [Streptomyces sp. SID13666]|uniref:sigma-70 family RNA polymerase sigma factor n=1 Tax=unclassified Streptomyces TaxID=2593676 RepID=UPI0013BF866B|nr:sigma-70 family RNA polymerase sigma factor [Streptomyces sp. SID13666]NEA76794.1 sigma-70 family RNA polymerase sigma factor [Streptomyces sp. SID13588]
MRIGSILRAAVPAWATYLARCRAVDRVRRAQAAARGRRDAAQRPQVVVDVAEEVLARREMERVRACLPALSFAQRECLGLAYFRGHTHRQIAERLSVPPGTVKTRIRTGLARLRRELTAPATGQPQRPGPAAALPGQDHPRANNTR